MYIMNKNLEQMRLKDLKKLSQCKQYTAIILERLGNKSLTKEQFLEDAKTVLDIYHKRNIEETYEIYKDVEYDTYTIGGDEPYLQKEITEAVLTIYYREKGSSQFFLEVYTENGELLTKEEAEPHEVYGTRVYGGWKTAKTAKKEVLKGFIK